jgi:hypothetical protein
MKAEMSTTTKMMAKLPFIASQTSRNIIIQQETNKFLIFFFRCVVDDDEK